MSAVDDDILLFEAPLVEDHPDNVARMPMPWEQRHDEGEKHYAAFTFFRGMHPHDRRYSHVAREFALCDRTIQHWARLYDWRARVMMWDDFSARNEEAAREHEIAQMAVRHRNTARLGVSMLGRKLSAMTEDKEAIAAMPLREAMGLFRMCAKIEREAWDVEMVLRRAHYESEDDDP